MTQAEQLTLATEKVSHWKTGSPMQTRCSPSGKANSRTLQSKGKPQPKPTAEKLPEVAVGPALEAALNEGKVVSMVGAKAKGKAKPKKLPSKH